jgi:hypothetical protein
MLLYICLNLHDKYVVVHEDNAPNNIVLCVNHLIKELSIDSSLANPKYTSTTLTKEEIKDSYRSVFVFLMKTGSYNIRHSNGYLNYTSVLTNSVILTSLPNVPLHTEGSEENRID